MTKALVRIRNSLNMSAKIGRLSVMRMVLALAVSCFIGGIAAIPVQADQIGPFESISCDGSRCSVAGETFDKKDLKRATSFYNSLKQADSTLKKRGFNDAARVVLIWRYYSYESEWKAAAAAAYLRQVHNNTPVQVGRIPSGHGLEALKAVMFDPVTGRNLFWQGQVVVDCQSTKRSVRRPSPIQMAGAISKCMASSSPHRTCQMNYSPAYGIRLGPEYKTYKASLQSNPNSWWGAECADLPIIPTASNKPKSGVVKIDRAQRD
ncbi:MAG: hypothetical protein KDJ16_02630 [Hyphomicrobiales bacterium]|nr:hypothetical protein [Hyphomicrobiales bacterium]